MEPPWPASARGDSWMRGEGCGIGSGWLRGERGSRLLPGVTALTHLSLHHNLSGNAGHLTICHCVGASPANQCQEHLAWKPGLKIWVKPNTKRLLNSLLLGFKSIECPRLILLPKEETGPPVARVLSCQTCHGIEQLTFLLLCNESWLYYHISGY